MKLKSYPLSRVYGLLEPGPVVLLTTAAGDRRNVMAQSWHTMLEFEPPMIGAVVSDRNHSFSLLEDSGECVIGIPTVEIADKVAGCGNTSGADTDKFARFSLSALPSSLITPPLIGECYANLECRVTDTGMVDRYGMFVLEVVKAWIDPRIDDPRTIHHLGRGNFMVAGERIRLKSKAK